MNIKVLRLTPGKTLVLSLETFMAKNTPFGAFLMFVQNVIMYVVIVVFYGAEFKFTGPVSYTHLTLPTIA